MADHVLPSCRDLRSGSFFLPSVWQWESAGIRLEEIQEKVFIFVLGIIVTFRQSDNDVLI